MRCAACGTENPENQRFCGECGARLSRLCPACSAPAAANQKFCGECGSRLDDVAAPVEGPVAERRVVSVLFADLVSFTVLGEKRDAEDVRELLSRYFDTARTIVARYGGVVEKFIGDAVMAVWGTPSRHEDDAERAVRAGLDLVAAVTSLGIDAGVDGLQARAGVVTGETAVTIGATGQGMVAGDAVNTAARVQSVAEPGTVLIDEDTWRSVSASIACVDVGERALKGKDEPVHVFRAERVIAGSRGAQRADAMEPPFVGRDGELRMLKELFHTSAEQRRARLVLVTGLSGVGKSRLAWEFFKYLDGLADTVYWHVGRCLPYGEGVAYWALAEIVRMRLRLVEADPQTVVTERLDEWLDTEITERTEREWLRPRLATLLGAASAAEGTFERADLFAAWRRFFEHLTRTLPVVLVIEDMQWADRGLLDFLDHLLDWASDSPIYVVALGRPELYERHPGWTSARRTTTVIALDPLDDVGMSRLVDGLVDNMPAPVRAALVQRAEGVPLYAVETVRMLLDRGLVRPREGRYTLVGDADSALLAAEAVPSTLQAVVGARLDALTAEERQLVQDAAVLGLSFTADDLAEISTTGIDVPATLASLMAKQVLGVQADSRSPDRGQYRFLQGVVRSVAHATLSKRDRRQRHLAVAELLKKRPDADDLAPVIASHYLEAVVDGDADADGLKAQALEQLRRGGDRATELGAPVDARRYYEHALELAAGDATRAELEERLGEVCIVDADYPAAEGYLAAARAYSEQIGDATRLTRILARQGELGFLTVRPGDTLTLLKQGYEIVRGQPPGPELAEVVIGIGRCLFFLGEYAEGLAWCERGLSTAEASGATRAWIMGLNYRALCLLRLDRPRESLGLLQMAADANRRNPADAFYPVFNNLSLFAAIRDLDVAEASAEEGLSHAERTGDRDGLAFMTVERLQVHYLRGEWDIVESKTAEALARDWGSARGAAFLPSYALHIAAWRRDVERADELALLLREHETEDVDMQAYVNFQNGLARWSRGDAAGALDEMTRGERSKLLSDTHPIPTVYAMQFALECGRHDWIRERLGVQASRGEGALSPFELAFQLRFSAMVGLLPDVASAFERAERVLSDLGTPFHLALVSLDHAEWAAGEGHANAPALAASALEVFERLRVGHLANRARALVAAEAEFVTASP